MAERRPEPALAVSGISKVYGGEVALANVSMSVQAGEIRALLGANGAGKSTLVKIVCGVEPQDMGTVAIGGHRLPVPHSPAAADQLGLAHIHQDRALVPDLSIAENVALEIGFPRRRRMIDGAAVRAQARRALERVALACDVETPVGELPIADQTLVAIARALAVDCRVLLLDEPTASLGRRESRRLYETLAALAPQGVACVLITHALGDALEVCDSVTVLRDGRHVATRACAEVTEDELTAMVVGPAAESPARAHAAAPAAGDGAVANGGDPAAVRFRATGLRYDRLGPLSLEVRGGEILGVTGLAGTGYLLLGGLLTGATAPDAGTMELDGAPYRPGSVGQAVAAGVAHVPPDRLQDGLAVDLTARENLFMAARGFRGRAGIRRRDERAAAAAVLARARVKPPEPEAIVATMSGGNMQKLLIAKWLGGAPRLVVLSEPTVGVDVGARADIYAQLRERCAQGLAVIVASSDLEEVAELCDRVIVLRAGKPVAELAREDASVPRLTSLISASIQEAVL